MISEDEAISIAKRYAEEKGWGFLEPIHVEPIGAFINERKWWQILRSGPTTIVQYKIQTLYRMYGAKARFVIDARNGEVLSSGYIPR